MWYFKYFVVFTVFILKTPRGHSQFHHLGRWVFEAAWPSWLASQPNDSAIQARQSTQKLNILIKLKRSAHTQHPCKVWDEEKKKQRSKIEGVSESVRWRKITQVAFILAIIELFLYENLYVNILGGCRLKFADKTLVELYLTHFFYYIPSLRDGIERTKEMLREKQKG